MNMQKCIADNDFLQKEIINEQQENYIKYRGKCKEFCEKAILDDPSLRLVRGHYLCPFWGPQEHWWTERPDGTIFDPTVKQFPEPQLGEYIEFNGICTCEQCGKEVKEEDAIMMGRYPVCSDRCARYLVGV